MLVEKERYLPPREEREILSLFARLKRQIHWYATGYLNMHLKFIGIKETTKEIYYLIQFSNNIIIIYR